MRIISNPAGATVMLDGTPVGVTPLSLPAASDDADEERLMASSAVQLFVQRVSGRLQDFELAPAQQHAVAAICRALDGMPHRIDGPAAMDALLRPGGMNDALDAAFTELDGLGIVALQNAGYTQSDGWDDAREIAGGVQDDFGVALVPEPVFVGHAG